MYALSVGSGFEVVDDDFEGEADDDGSDAVDADVDFGQETDGEAPNDNSTGLVAGVDLVVVVVLVLEVVVVLLNKPTPQFPHQRMEER